MSRGYEKRDIRFGALLLFGGVLVMVLLGVGLSSRWALRLISHEPGWWGASTTPVSYPPEPRLQADPRHDLQVLRQEEDETLNHYGWVNRPEGVVRIPIDRAMKILAERGLPVRSGNRRGPA